MLYFQSLPVFKGRLWTIIHPSYFSLSRLYISFVSTKCVWHSHCWQMPPLRCLCYPSVKSSVCTKLENTLWHIWLPRISLKVPMYYYQGMMHANTYKSPIVKASTCICSLEVIILPSPIIHINNHFPCYMLKFIPGSISSSSSSWYGTGTANLTQSTINVCFTCLTQFR